jgi:hypothetical protein
MVRPRLPWVLARALVATCALVWVSACGSSGSTGAKSSAGDAGGSSGGQTDSGSGADGATGPVDGSADSRVADGASDSSQRDDEPAATVPTCNAGDRTEFSGPVASTGLAVAVCSACGASYVVTSNGTAGAGQVSVANGSQTITVDVAAGGMATSANLADDPADGTVTVCATMPSQSCLPKTPNQRYCNPYRDITSLVQERIDQGVDYGGAGPIYAMGPGTIDVYKNRNDTGWPGGTFVSYKVTAGPAAGKEIYLAENIDLNASLQSLSFVYNGTVLGTLVDASPDSESGWGVAGEGITAEYSCYTEGCDTPLGDNFNALLVCLKTPPGVPGTGGCCPQPTGYPTDWCTPLAAWQ